MTHPQKVFLETSPETNTTPLTQVTTQPLTVRKEGESLKGSTAVLERVWEDWDRSRQRRFRLERRVDHALPLNAMMKQGSNTLSEESSHEVRSRKGGLGALYQTTPSLTELQARNPLLPSRSVQDLVSDEGVQLWGEGEGCGEANAFAKPHFVMGRSKVRLLQYVRALTHAQQWGLWIHIHTSYTNTLATVTNPEGKTLFQTSAGQLGFKKARRSSTYAALRVGETVGRWLLTRLEDRAFQTRMLGEDPERRSASLGHSPKVMHTLPSKTTLPIHVMFRGLATTRSSVLKGLKQTECPLTSLWEGTRRPHNGCRPPAQRRV